MMEKGKWLSQDNFQGLKTEADAKIFYLHEISKYLDLDI